MSTKAYMKALLSNNIMGPTCFFILYPIISCHTYSQLLDTTGE